MARGNAMKLPSPSGTHTKKLDHVSHRLRNECPIQQRPEYRGRNIFYIWIDGIFLALRVI